MQFDDKTFHTYEGWQDEGMQVMKGQKAQMFQDGIAYFSEEQVYDPSESDDYQELDFNDFPGRNNGYF